MLKLPNIKSYNPLFFSQGEDEGDGEDDDEDDDGFFVPHGYLSDDEGVAEDEDLEDGNSKEGDDGKVLKGSV